MSEGDARKKVVESLHATDGLYCVDVVQTGGRFSLQTCRRDEERWHVIDHAGEHPTPEAAIVSARRIVSGLE